MNEDHQRCLRALTGRAARQLVNRAIVIDFEGEGVSFTERGRVTAPAPVLLGMQYPGGYDAHVLDPVLRPLASGRRSRPGLAGRARAASLAEAVGAVIDRAEAEGRAIAHFSHHERSTIRSWLGEDRQLVARFERLAFDVKKELDRRVGRGWLAPPAERSLDGYARRLLPPRAPHSISGRVGRTIRDVRFRVAGRRRWSDCPPGVRRHWEELLAYNREDCDLTRAVMLAALRRDRPDGRA